MIFGILFVGLLVVTAFMLAASFLLSLDGTKGTGKFIFLGIILIGVSYGIYNLAFNIGTLWVNAGYETFVVKNIDIDNYSVEYKGKSYKIDNLIDKSNKSKEIEYSVIVENKNATPGLFSVYIFPNMRVREDVTVYIQPRAENKDNLDN